MAYSSQGSFKRIASVAVSVLVYVALLRLPHVAALPIFIVTLGASGKWIWEARSRYDAVYWRGVMVAGGASALVLVAKVLAASAWQNETVLWLHLCAGMGGAFTAWRLLGWAQGLNKNWLYNSLVGTLTLASLATVLLWDGEHFPVWHRKTAQLAALAIDPDEQHPIATEQFVQAWPLLDQLWAAGFADACALRTAFFLHQGADAESLRAACVGGKRRGGLGDDAHWKKVLDIGLQACAALKKDRVEGASTLESSDIAMLRRLAGDLWMEVGDIERARRNYLAATARGDVLAQEAYSAQAWQRNLLNFEEQFGTDLLAWQSYNHLLDEQRPVSKTRARLRVIDAPGDIVSKFDNELKRHVWVVRSSYQNAFGVELPLPPSAVVPSQLTVQFKYVRDFRVVVSNRSGQSMIYACGCPAPGPQERCEDLGATNCNTHWATVQLPLATKLSGPLASIVMRGEFELGHLDAQVPDLN